MFILIKKTPLFPDHGSGKKGVFIKNKSRTYPL